MDEDEDEDEDEAVLSDAEFCAVVWGDVEYCSGFVVAAGFGEFAGVVVDWVVDEEGVK